MRDMDLGVPVAGDSWRLEVVVDGLPLFGGATCNRHNVGVKYLLRGRRESGHPM